MKLDTPMITSIMKKAFWQGQLSQKFNKEEEETTPNGLDDAMQMDLSAVLEVIVVVDKRLMEKNK